MTIHHSGGLAEDGEDLTKQIIIGFPGRSLSTSFCTVLQLLHIWALAALEPRIWVRCTPQQFSHGYLKAHLAGVAFLLELCCHGLLYSYTKTDGVKVNLNLNESQYFLWGVLVELLDLPKAGVKICLCISCVLYWYQWLLKLVNDRLSGRWEF